MRVTATICRGASSAEALGTALLLATVVGSGIMAERLSGGNDGLALLANTLATGASCRPHPDLRPDLGRAFQPGGHGWCSRSGANCHRLWPPPTARPDGRCRARRRLAHAMFDLPLLHAGRRRAPGSGSGSASSVATSALLSRSRRPPRHPRRRHTRSGSDHRRLLVHRLHLLRQPGCDRRPEPHRHLRRHRAGRRARLRGGAVRRRLGGGSRMALAGGGTARRGRGQAQARSGHQRTIGDGAGPTPWRCRQSRSTDRRPAPSATRRGPCSRQPSAPYRPATRRRAPATGPSADPPGGSARSGRSAPDDEAAFAEAAQVVGDVRLGNPGRLVEGLAEHDQQVGHPREGHGDLRVEAGAEAGKAHGRSRPRPRPARLHPGPAPRAGIRQCSGSVVSGEEGRPAAHQWPRCRREG